MKNLKNYSKITTEDGSSTFFSEVYAEACHSTSGAKTETQTHYIKGCEVDKRAASSKQLNIFEVGFGVGIGFTESMNICKEHNCFLNFISTEIDPQLTEAVLIELGFKFQKNNDYFISKGEGYKLIILNGNARESIKNISNIFSEKFNAIYQDAFSPKRNSILWTTQWFTDLKTIAASDCIMSTYSSSSSVRKSMMAAGWFLYHGVKFGPKRSSTRARLTGETELDIIERMKCSPAIELTDDNYKTYKMDQK